MKQLIKKYPIFFLFLASFLLAENFSFLVSYFSLAWLNNICFALIVIATLCFTLKDIKNGLLILLAELFIGSKGYLFFLTLTNGEIVGGLNLPIISLRIALFLIIIGVFLLRLAQRKVKFRFNSLSLLITYLLLIISILFAMWRGWQQGNLMSNVFFDANGWWYFILLIIFFSLIDSWLFIKRIGQLFVAALVWLSIKTILIFLVFIGQNNYLMFRVYQWLAFTQIGEVTHVIGNFWRVFIQSQIYLSLGWLILASSYIFLKIKKIRRSQLFLLLLTGLPIIISFSRSFWLGLLVGLLCLFISLLMHFSYSAKKVVGLLFILCLLVLVDFGMVYSTVQINGGLYFGGIFKQRLINLTEPAVSSRTNQLMPLLKEINQHRLLGGGFGSTITYYSDDPYILDKTGSRLHTTYTSEWGWLDICLKLGLIGVCIYVLFIIHLWRNGWKVINNIRQSEQQGLILGLLIGLIGLVVINITSPYLNHPLGIGYLMLVGAILNYFLTNNLLVGKKLK